MFVQNEISLWSIGDKKSASKQFLLLIQDQTHQKGFNASEFLNCFLNLFSLVDIKRVKVIK